MSDYTWLFVLAADIDEDDTHQVKTNVWDNQNTLQFLDLYKNMQGRFQDKNVKKKLLWKSLSQQLEEHGATFSPAQVEGKMKVLVRAYKRFLANKNKTGAKAKFFAFADQMHELMGHRHDIQPLHVSGTNLQPAQPAQPPQQRDVEVVPQPLPAPVAKKGKAKAKTNKPEDENVLEFLKEYTTHKEAAQAQRFEDYKNIQERKMDLFKDFMGVIAKK